MCNIQYEFYRTCQENLDKTDFVALYNDISEKGTYSPDRLIDLLYSSVYLLERHKGEDVPKKCGLLVRLIHCLDEENRPSLSKLQLLYIITQLEKNSQPPSPTRSFSGLYL